MSTPNWKKEGFLDFDIPGIIDYLVATGFLKDTSYKNDSSPRFTLSANEDADSGILLWVQHPLRGHRDVDDDFGRFIVEEGKFSDERCDKRSFDTDDLEEALSRIFGMAADDRYSDVTSGQPWFDPDDIAVTLNTASAYSKKLISYIPRAEI